MKLVKFTNKDVKRQQHVSNRSGVVLSREVTKTLDEPELIPLDAIAKDLGLGAEAIFPQSKTEISYLDLCMSINGAQKVFENKTFSGFSTDKTVNQAKIERDKRIRAAIEKFANEVNKEEHNTRRGLTLGVKAQDFSYTKYAYVAKRALSSQHGAAINPLKQIKQTELDSESNTDSLQFNTDSILRIDFRATSQDTESHLYAYPLKGFDIANGKILRGNTPAEQTSFTEELTINNPKVGAGEFVVLNPERKQVETYKIEDIASINVQAPRPVDVLSQIAANTRMSMAEKINHIEFFVSKPELAKIREGLIAEAHYQLLAQLEAKALTLAAVFNDINIGDFVEISSKKGQGSVADLLETEKKSIVGSAQQYLSGLRNELTTQYSRLSSSNKADEAFANAKDSLIQREEELTKSIQNANDLIAKLPKLQEAGKKLKSEKLKAYTALLASMLVGLGITAKTMMPAWIGSSKTKEPDKALKAKPDPKSILPSDSKGVSGPKEKDNKGLGGPKPVEVNKKENEKTSGGPDPSPEAKILISANLEKDDVLLVDLKDANSSDKKSTPISAFVKVKNVDENGLPSFEFVNPDRKASLKLSNFLINSKEDLMVFKKYNPKTFLAEGTKAFVLLKGTTNYFCKVKAKAPFRGFQLFERNNDSELLSSDDISHIYTVQAKKSKKK